LILTLLMLFLLCTRMASCFIKPVIILSRNSLLNGASYCCNTVKLYLAPEPLSTVDYGDGQTQGYTFDAMGNRLGKTDSVAGATSYDYDAANRLMLATGAGGDRYASDADGNTTTSGRRTNVWDSQNRLVSCTANGTTSTYTYGADGLRRSATVNGVTTYYVYDGTMMVREMQQNAQGVLQSMVTYLNGPRGPEYRRDDTQAEGMYTDSGGVQHPAGKTRWYVYDGLGSVVGEVDPSGNITSSGTFDVYGAKRSGGTGTATSRQGFVGSLGHVTDSETGLVYMRARYYDPNVGRFISQDAAKNGMNWFAYCHNNPINNVDPDGKSDITLYFAGEVGAILMLALGCLLIYGTEGLIAMPEIGLTLIVCAVVAIAVLTYALVEEFAAAGVSGAAAKPVAAVENFMDTAVTQLKEAGGSAAVAGHTLELDFACAEIDLE